MTLSAIAIGNQIDTRYYSARSFADAVKMAHMFNATHVFWNNSEERWLVFLTKKDYENYLFENNWSSKLLNNNRYDTI